MVAPLLPLITTPRRSLAFGDWFAPFDLLPARGEAITAKCTAPLALWEDDEHLQLEVDLPGVLQEDLDVTVHDSRLYVRGERKQPDEERHYLLDETRYGKFEYVLSLPKTIDTASIDAKLNGGVLRVTLAKKPELQPHRISVKSD